MENALQVKPPLPFLYVAGKIAQVLIARYFRLQVICGIIALLHVLAERLYFGKSPEKVWVGLLIALVSVTLIGDFWLQPKLNGLHTMRYDPKASREARDDAAQSFRAWHGVSQVVNLLLIGGLGLYLWRVANPPDTTRFLSAGKFRG